MVAKVLREWLTRIGTSNLYIELGRESHTPLPVNANIRYIYEAALSKGLGEMDFFVLVQEASRAELTS